MNKKNNGYLINLAWLTISLGLVQHQPSAADLAITPGKFSGTMESLTNYVCPDWFRDAKFGIWAHWGPQALPMEGDWYARKMYYTTSPNQSEQILVLSSEV
jgi:alpha-L-fucosidase